MIKNLLQTVSTGVAIALIILIVIGVFCIAPWLFFWSVGELFGNYIAFTFWNWLAAVVLLGLLRGGK